MPPTKKLIILKLIALLLIGSFFAGRFFIEQTTNVRAVSELGLSSQGSTVYPSGGFRLNKTISDVLPDNAQNYGLTLVDPVNKKLYATTCLAAGSEVVVKVNLETEVIEQTLSLHATDSCAGAIALDSANNELYIGLSMDGAPGRIIKINTSTFTRVSALDLNAGEEGVRGIAIDVTNGFIYVNTADSPAKVVKINKSAFTRVGAITFNAGENQSQYVAPDFSNNLIYYVTYTNPAKVVKVNTNTFSRVGSLDLSVDGGWGIIIDTDRQKLYVGGYNDVPNTLAKINLATFTEESVLTLDANDFPANIRFDSVRNRIFINDDDTPSDLLAVDAHSFTLIGKITAGGYMAECGLDTVTTKYYCVDSVSGDLKIYDTSSRGYIFGTKAVLTDTVAVPELVKMYTHVSGGNIRMAIYDPDRRLVWESPIVANTGGSISSAISSGNIPNLKLPTGTYYLAFQTDSVFDIPSYTSGGAGDGFYIPHVFGAFPSQINGQSNTTEKYTMYVTYALESSQGSGSSGGAALPIGGGSFYNPSTASGGGGGSSPDATPQPETIPAPTPAPPTVSTGTTPEPVTTPSMGLKYSEIISGVSYASKVVKTKDNPTVYYITAQGYKLPYPTWEAYTSYGKTKEDILILNQDEINAFPDITYITVNNNTYSITPQGKVTLITPEQLSIMSINRDQLLEINTTHFGAYR